MADARLTLKIDGESASAVGAVRDVDKATGGMSKNAAVAGGVMVAAGVAITGALVGVAKASGDAHVAHLKLENTIANMPALAGASKAAFDDQARSLSRMTAAEDDAITAGQAMLGTFNLTQRQMLAMMPLVVDYSRKFGVDMVASATQIGRALDGSIMALKRNGVSIDENLYKTDRYAAVQKALRDQVGGFAEQEARSFPGAVEKMRNSLGNLAETAGGPVAEDLSALADSVADLSDSMSDFGEANPSVTRGIVRVAEGAALFSIVGGTAVVTAAKLKTSMEALGGAAALAKTGLLGAAIVGGGAFNAAIHRGIGELTGYNKVLAAELNWLQKQGAVGQTVASISARLNGITLQGTRARKDTTKATAAQVTATLAEASAAAQEAAAQQDLTRSLNGTKVAADSLAGKQRSLKEADLANRQAALDVRDARKRLADAIKENGRNSDEAKAAQIRLEQAELGAKDAAADYTGALNDWNAAAADAKQRADAIAAANKRIKDSANAAADALDKMFGKGAGAATRAAGGYGGRADRAAGAIEPATPGGRWLRVAEDGSDEALIPINDRPRSYALLAETMRRMGVGPPKVGGNTYIFAPTFPVASRQDAPYMRQLAQQAMAVFSEYVNAPVMTPGG